MNTAGQLLLLVDKNDRFLGKYASKTKCHTGRGLHHRAFTIIILNEKGEVLLQKRKHKLWDKTWDLTNSHPLHRKNGDETYKEAARRCLKREWGIETPVKKIFGFNYYAGFGKFCENEYCAVLIAEYSGKVFPNPKVAWGFKWLPLGKLLKDIKIHRDVYTPWLVDTLRLLEDKNLIKN